MRNSSSVLVAYLKQRNGMFVERSTCVKRVSAYVRMDSVLYPHNARICGSSEFGGKYHGLGVMA